MDTPTVQKHQHTRTAVRNFIRDTFLFGMDDERLTDDVSFLESGIIDSTGLLELIGFVESEYGISIAEWEMMPQNLDSIDNIARFVHRKTAGAGAAE